MENKKLTKDLQKWYEESKSIKALVSAIDILNKDQDCPSAIITLDFYLDSEYLGFIGGGESRYENEHESKVKTFDQTELDISEGSGGLSYMERLHWHKYNVAERLIKNLDWVFDEQDVFNTYEIC